MCHLLDLFILKFTASSCKDEFLIGASEIEISPLSSYTMVYICIKHSASFTTADYCMN